MHLENKNTHDSGESCHTQGEAVVDTWEEILVLHGAYRRKYWRNSQAAKKSESQELMVNQCKLKTSTVPAKMWSHLL